MASKRRQKRKQCQGKTKYESQETAVAAANARRRRWPGEVVDAYRCQVCGEYHVGRRPGNVTKIINNRRENK